MELRINPSDEKFPEVDCIAAWIARLKNPQLFHDLKGIPEIERLVGICDMEDLFEMKVHEVLMGRLLR